MNALTLLITAGALVLGAAAPASAADPWPVRPVRIVAPFAAGGSSDILGRIVAEGLTAAFKQQFYVENRPGNGGALGSAMVARSAPDGYTLVISGVASHVAGPAMNPNIEYDPIADFTHMAMLGGEAPVLVVHPRFGARTLAGLVERAKREELAWAASSAGALSHLAGEYFQQKAGIQMRHVPYKGGSAAVVDVIAGHVPIGLFPFFSAGEYIRSGALIPLATMAPRRVANIPEVPTFAESGYPEIVMTSWFALSGPSGIAPELAERLNLEVRAILKSPAVRERLEKDASFVPDLDLAQLKRFYQEEVARWAAVAKSAHLIMK